MTADEIVAILNAEPFVPLQAVDTAGKTFDIPFKHAARLNIGGLLIFRGVPDAKTRQATGFDVIGYDRVARILPKKSRGTGRPSKRKAG